MNVLSGWPLRLVRFLLSIQFGVLLLLSLMFVMMFATQFEASTSTRAMKRFIYGSAWFDAGVYLFVVNIVVNTWRRRPYRLRHIGFLTVHVGVLTIVAGGLTTRYAGIDGTMPIPEKAEAREILLPDSDLIVEAAGQSTRYPTEYELAPWRSDLDDLYAVPGTPYYLRAERYLPTGVVVDTLRNDAEEVNPILRVAIASPGHEPETGWIARDEPAGTFDHGHVLVRFAASPDSIAEAFRERSDRRDAGAPGKLTIFYTGGGQETIEVSPAAARLPASRSGVEIEVVQIFRSFQLAESGPLDAPNAPENPAFRFRVKGPSGIENHIAFTHFPEFRVEPPEGVEWIVSHAAWDPGASAFSPEQLEVAVALHAAGGFSTWTSWGDPTDGTPLALAETRSFESVGVNLRLLEYAERGRITSTVQKVSDEVKSPVLHLALCEADESAKIRLASAIDLLRGRRPVRSVSFEPNRVWLFHGESYELATPEGPIRIEYQGQAVPLDFGIELVDFREETYPGIALAASYESEVVVKPSTGEPFTHEIYMNHPLKYAGFTFYQASFQRTQDGQEITVLSVARDPGMKISFFGYCVLIAGLFLIFFVKPYFRKLDDRIARSRALRSGGAHS